jgi:hypothetical protein
MVDEVLPHSASISDLGPKQGLGISGEGEMNRASRNIQLLDHQARSPEQASLFF